MRWEKFFKIIMADYKLYTMTVNICRYTT